MRFLLGLVFVALALLPIFLRTQDRLSGPSASSKAIEDILILRRDWVRCSLDLLDRSVAVLACEQGDCRELLSLYSRPVLAETFQNEYLDAPGSPQDSGGKNVGESALPESSAVHLLNVNSQTLGEFLKKMQDGSIKSNSELLHTASLVRASIQLATDTSYVPLAGTNPGGISWFGRHGFNGYGWIPYTKEYDDEWPGLINLAESLNVPYYRYCISINSELLSRRALGLQTALAAASQDKSTQGDASLTRAKAFAVDAAFARDLELLGYTRTSQINWLSQPRPDKSRLLNLVMHVSETRESLEKAENRWRLSLR